MKAISTYVIPSLIYSCGISWSQTDFKILARIIRTKMTGVCTCNKKSRSERFLIPKNGVVLELLICPTCTIPKLNY